VENSAPEVSQDKTTEEIENKIHLSAVSEKQVKDEAPLSPISTEKPAEIEEIVVTPENLQAESEKNLLQ
jgi:hypothetical protein